MAKIEAKSIGTFIGIGIALLTAFAAVAKTYYVLPAELNHQIQSLKELKADEKEHYQELRLICKELDTKVDGIDNAIEHNSRDVLYYTKELGEVKILLREIQKELRK